LKIKTDFLKVLPDCTAVFYTINLANTVKIAEMQSGQAAQPAHPMAKKKGLIRCPKGSNWTLQDSMGLGNDEAKYKQIIVRLHSQV